MPRGDSPRRPRRTAQPRSRTARRRPARAKRPRSLAWRVFRALMLTGFVFGLIAAAAVAGYMRYLDTTITATFEGRRWSVPAVIYAQPLELFPGALLSMANVTRELNRLGYREATGTPPPGSYQRGDGSLDIHLRSFRFIEGPRESQRIRLRFRQGTLVDVSDPSGRAVPLIRLDPAAIGSFFPSHGEDRVVLAPDQVPPLLVETLKIIEDRNFDQHPGFDLAGIIRALWVNVRAGEIQQGGSTLTQQLVKSYYLDNRRTIERKVRELLMAIILDARFAKPDILNAYVNEIFLGQDGRRAVHGFGLGAQFYFNKPIDELGADEIATLVAVIRGPSFYNPYRHPERALARRDFVLDRMLESGLITATGHTAAKQQPLRVVRGARLGGMYYPAYMDLVRRRLDALYQDDDLTTSGLQIFTTLNPPVQESIEQAIAETLQDLEQSRKLPANTLQAAAVVTSIQTGEVLALAGGRVAGFDGFNRALNARRPIGSLVKPVIYLKALESGYNLTTILDDAPVNLTLNRQTWSPNNYDRRVYGPVPLVRALGNSLNLATVQLGLRLGVEEVADRLETLSGHRPANRFPSLLLGAEAMTPLEVAGMYGTLASGGFYMAPKAVVAVLDETGQPLSRHSIEVEQRIAPDVASTLVRAMEAAMRYGTGRSSRFARAGVAGKTGTTDDYRDSWFAGFDGVHLVVTWIGTDDNQPTQLSGATGALKVWDAIMTRLAVRPLHHPPSNTLRTVDYQSGLLADESCSEELVSVPVPWDAALQTHPGCGIYDRSLSERVREWMQRF
ncbi:MAG: penicillin-binding protein 1B [Pseudomonadales bacterium]|nr:penicillin-binding protein 1B [Pseudomonadales bacterium]